MADFNNSYDFDHGRNAAMVAALLEDAAWHIKQTSERGEALSRLRGTVSVCRDILQQRSGNSDD